MITTWPDHPRAAATYDAENGTRDDLAFYSELAHELRASSVVDIGCGTGILCVDLARAGIAAIGVDPGGAVLDIARTRPGAELVEWIHGTARSVPDGAADLVVMTAHVAQYFLCDDEWAQVLQDTRRILRPGGHLAFEARVPDRDWFGRWREGSTRATLPHPDGGEFTTWVEIVAMTGTIGDFIETHVGHTVLPDGEHLAFEESLRFRSESAIRESLRGAGFAVAQLWGDWDRSPVTAASDELIFLARR